MFGYSPCERLNPGSTRAKVSDDRTDRRPRIVSAVGTPTYSRPANRAEAKIAQYKYPHSSAQVEPCLRWERARALDQLDSAL